MRRRSPNLRSPSADHKPRPPFVRPGRQRRLQRDDGAVDPLARTLAKELAPKQIRVDSLNPGMVETEGLHASGFIAGRDGYSTLTALGRIGQPDDIAPIAVLLASPGSSWITGETFYVEGGGAPIEQASRSYAEIARDLLPLLDQEKSRKGAFREAPPQ